MSADNVEKYNVQRTMLKNTVDHISTVWSFNSNFPLYVPHNTTKQRLPKDIFTGSHQTAALAWEVQI